MKKISFLFILTFIIVGFFSIKNLLGEGYFPMHDDTQPTRVFLMKEAISDGQFPVRWVEHLGYGYGYPIFNFYAPLPYYLGALFMFLGFDSIDAVKILFIVATTGSFLTMYIFLKKFTNQFGAICAAVIYTLFPYHAVNTYVRGALSEQFGYLFIPLVLLSYLKVAEHNLKKKSIFWPILLGVSSALVVLSHNLSVIIISISLLPILVVNIIRSRKRKKFISHILIAIAVCFGLTAFYVLPVIVESRFTNVSSQVGGGADFRDHFVCVGQLWNSSWGFGGSTPDCQDGISFKLGKTNILFFIQALLIGIYSVFKTKRAGVDSFYTGAVLSLVGLFFILSFSSFLWVIIPALEYVQYPWRFLTVVSLGISIVIGFAVSEVSGLVKKPYLQYGIVFIVVLLTLLNNSKLFYPQKNVLKDLPRYTDVSSIRYDISKISDEYMPENFNKPKSFTELQNSYISGSSGLTISKIESSSKAIQAEIMSYTDQKVLINIAPYPSWDIYVDGKRAEYKNTSNGIEIPIAKGEHAIVARFTQTPPQFVGNLITIITIFTLGAVIMRKLYVKKTT